MDTFIVTAEKLLYGGDALARREDGKAVFIPYAVPGDRLLVRTRAEKKNYLRAEILEILTSGDDRITPACPHFGKCGGCHWQQVEYSRQAEAKRLILEELFNHRFPETKRLAVTMQPCPQPFGYRSRARIRRQVTHSTKGGHRSGGSHPVLQNETSLQGVCSFNTSDANAAVGFFRGGSHIVEDIESCLLFRPHLNDALRALREIPFEQAVSENPGLCVTLPRQNAHLPCVNSAFVSVASPDSGVFGGRRQLNPNRMDNIQEIDIAGSEEDGKWAIAKGGDVERSLLRRKVGEFTYNVAAGTFFQANDFMIDSLVTHVLDCASYDSGSALDLFSGVGLFSLPLSRRFRAVTAVEYSRGAHRLCSLNAAAAGIKNLQTVCADAAIWMDSQTESRFDCVVLDPPRAGAGPDVMELAGRLACSAIVYVSCDPQTLVRDLERLDRDSWQIISIAGFDMFPQTYHFETVVHLKR